MSQNTLKKAITTLFDTIEANDLTPSEYLASLAGAPTPLTRAYFAKFRHDGSNLEGYPLPTSLLVEPRMTRNSTASDFGSGGAFVATDLQTEAIRLVFNRSVVIGSGAQVIDGLKGNYARSKVVSAPDVQSLSETAPVAASDILASQDALKPCRISAQVVVSKQLAFQGGATADRAIRQTITDAITTALDRAFLFGQGRDEPLGIFNWPGVSSFLFDGPASWPVIVGAEQQLASANMDLFKIGWATSPLARARWKQISKIAETNYPRFILEDGLCNEYPVLSSTQLSGQNNAILAGWDTIETLFWGAPGNPISILVDPVTKAAEGKIAFTALLYANINVPYPQAINISSDAANQ
jgi:hypothetical protein